MSNFLIVLAFIPSLFGYGSKQQAKDACLEWKGKGVKHEYIHTWWDGDKSNLMRYARSCIEENETNQYLGYENYKIKKAKEWKQGDDQSLGKIIKHFRY